MTSEFSIWIFSIGLNFSNTDQSPPFHTPLVSGCVAPASLAHLKTCGNNADTLSVLSFGSPAAYDPPFPLSGSFHTSQPKTRSSFANAFTTPFTYASSRGYCEGSSSAAAPGLCTHREL